MKKLIEQTNSSPTRKVRCKHYAGIFYGNSLIALGYNQKKSHPLQSKFSDRPARIYLHAEIHALVEYFRAGYSFAMLSRCSIFVIRIGPDGSLADSKPCGGCMRAIHAFNFKELWHS